MSVHYKFKSALEYDTVAFDGLHISVADLKKAIIHQKRLGKNTDFDLQITNAQTQEVYNSNTALIPKNTSLMVARIPLSGVQQKKLWDRVETSGNQLALSSKSNEPGTEIINPSFERLAQTADLNSAEGSEEEKIRAMMQQSTKDYDPANYQKIRGANQIGVVPSTYRCFKCFQTGHWIKNCPLNQDSIEIKKSTGIPRSFMVPVAGPTVPGAMMTPTGHYAVPTIDHQAYKDQKKEKPPFLQEPMVPIEKPPIPEELLCNLCRDLLSDAVLIPCCGTSYCDECVRTALLESEEHECPECHEKDVSPDGLIPNRYLRTAVKNYKNETGYIKSKKPPHQPPIHPQPAIQHPEHMGPNHVPSQSFTEPPPGYAVVPTSYGTEPVVQHTVTGQEIPPQNQPPQDSSRHPPSHHAPLEEPHHSSQPAPQKHPHRLSQESTHHHLPQEAHHPIPHHSQEPPPHLHTYSSPQEPLQHQPRDPSLQNPPPRQPPPPQQQPPRHTPQQPPLHHAPQQPPPHQPPHEPPHHAHPPPEAAPHHQEPQPCQPNEPPPQYSEPPPHHPHHPHDPPPNLPPEPSSHPPPTQYPPQNHPPVSVHSHEPPMGPPGVPPPHPPPPGVVYTSEYVPPGRRTHSGVPGEERCVTPTVDEHATDGLGGDVKNLPNVTVPPPTYLPPGEPPPLGHPPQQYPLIPRSEAGKGFHIQTLDAGPGKYNQMHGPPPPPPGTRDPQDPGPREGRYPHSGGLHHQQFARPPPGYRLERPMLGRPGRLPGRQERPPHSGSLVGPPPRVPPPRGSAFRGQLRGMRSRGSGSYRSQQPPPPGLGGPRGPHPLQQRLHSSQRSHTSSQQSVIDDPLEAFERMLREKDERDRVLKRQRRSRTRTRSRSRSRSRSFSRSTSHSPEHNPRSRSRSRSRSRGRSRSRSRSRVRSHSRSRSRSFTISRSRSRTRSFSHSPTPRSRSPVRYTSPKIRSQRFRGGSRTPPPSRFSREGPYKDNRDGRDARDVRDGRDSRDWERDGHDPGNYYAEEHHSVRGRGRGRGRSGRGRFDNRKDFQKDYFEEGYGRFEERFDVRTVNRDSRFEPVRGRGRGRYDSMDYKGYDGYRGSRSPHGSNRSPHGRDYVEMDSQRRYDKREYVDYERESYAKDYMDRGKEYHDYAQYDRSPYSGNYGSPEKRRRSFSPRENRESPDRKKGPERIDRDEKKKKRRKGTDKENQVSVGKEKEEERPAPTSRRQEAKLNIPRESDRREEVEEEKKKEKKIKEKKKKKKEKRRVSEDTEGSQIGESEGERSKKKKKKEKKEEKHGMKEELNSKQHEKRRVQEREKEVVKMVPPVITNRGKDVADGAPWQHTGSENAGVMYSRQESIPVHIKQDTVYASEQGEPIGMVNMTYTSEIEDPMGYGNPMDYTAVEYGGLYSGFDEPKVDQNIIATYNNVEIEVSTGELEMYQTGSTTREDIFSASDVQEHAVESAVGQGMVSGQVHSDPNCYQEGILQESSAEDFTVTPSADIPSGTVVYPVEQVVDMEGESNEVKVAVEEVETEEKRTSLKQGETDGTVMTAPVPELSKWELEEEEVEGGAGVEAGSEFTGEEHQGKMVTSDILKKAENAFFQKGISGIRPLEPKKVGDRRIYLPKKTEPEEERKIYTKTEDKKSEEPDSQADGKEREANQRIENKVVVEENQIKIESKEKQEKKPDIKKEIERRSEKEGDRRGEKDGEHRPAEKDGERRNEKEWTNEREKEWRNEENWRTEKEREGRKTLSTLQITVPAGSGPGNEERSVEISGDPKGRLRLNRSKFTYSEEESLPPHQKRHVRERLVFKVEPSHEIPSVSSSVDRHGRNERKLSHRTVYRNERKDEYEKLKKKSLKSTVEKKKSDSRSQSSERRYHGQSHSKERKKEKRREKENSRARSRSKEKHKGKEEKRKKEEKKKKRVKERSSRSKSKEPSINKRSSKNKEKERKKEKKKEKERKHKKEAGKNKKEVEEEHKKHKLGINAGEKIRELSVVQQGSFSEDSKQDGYSTKADVREKEGLHEKMEKEARGKDSEVKGRKKERKNPRLVVDRRKSTLDESHFEPDYDASMSDDSEESEEEEDIPSPRKRERSLSVEIPDLRKKQKSEEEKLGKEEEKKGKSLAHQRKKRRKSSSSSSSSSSSEESSSEESSSESESSSSEGENKVKPKKRRHSRSVTSSSDSESSSSDSERDRVKHKRTRKKGESKKKYKRKKKGKHK